MQTKKVKSKKKTIYYQGEKHTITIINHEKLNPEAINIGEIFYKDFLKTRPFTINKEGKYIKVNSKAAERITHDLIKDMDKYLKFKEKRRRMRQRKAYLAKLERRKNARVSEKNS